MEIKELKKWVLVGIALDNTTLTHLASEMGVHVSVLSKQLSGQPISKTLLAKLEEYASKSRKRAFAELALVEAGGE